MEKKILDQETRDRISFITFIILEFARAYKMNRQEAYRYLKKYGGLDYLFKHWWALHTDNPFLSKINMMTKIILFLTLLIFIGNRTFAQNRLENLSGKYSFYHSTNDYNEDYEMLRTTNEDGSISIRRGNPLPDDGCCTHKIELELKPDFSFYLIRYNDQGDYNTECESYGTYVIKGDTLTLFSPILPKIKKLEKVHEKIPRNLFKISFKNDGWTMGYLYKFLNNYKFYSLNEEYEKTEIKPQFTIPNKEKVDSTRGYDYFSDGTSASEIIGFSPSDVKVISFIFKRQDIATHLLVNQGYLINMSDYKYNNYFVGYQKNIKEDDFKRRYFCDYSDFSLIINDSILISIFQTSDEDGRQFYYEFIKQTQGENNK
jgi:hypothetical protein